GRLHSRRRLDPPMPETPYEREPTVVHSSALPCWSNADARDRFFIFPGCDCRGLFKPPEQQKGVRRKNESGRLAACRIYILPLRLLAARHYVASRPHAVGHLQSESHLTLSEPGPRSPPDPAHELRFDNRAQFP